MVFRMIHVENSRILPMDKVLSLGFTGICKTYLDGILNIFVILYNHDVDMQSLTAVLFL